MFLGTLDNTRFYVYAAILLLCQAAPSLAQTIDEPTETEINVEGRHAVRPARLANSNRYRARRCKPCDRNRPSSVRLRKMKSDTEAAFSLKIGNDKVNVVNAVQNSHRDSCESCIDEIGTNARRRSAGKANGCPAPPSEKRRLWATLPEHLDRVPAPATHWSR